MFYLKFISLLAVLSMANGANARELALKCDKVINGNVSQDAEFSVAKADVEFHLGKRAYFKGVFRNEAGQGDHRSHLFPRPKVFWHTVIDLVLSSQQRTLNVNCLLGRPGEWCQWFYRLEYNTLEKTAYYVRKYKRTLYSSEGGIDVSVLLKCEEL